VIRGGVLTGREEEGDAQLIPTKRDGVNRPESGASKATA
jgi:hypothetical protein